VSWRGCSQALPSCFSCMLYYCFTTALLLLYYCFTYAGEAEHRRQFASASKSLRQGGWFAAVLLLYYCFTTALLLLYYCFTTASASKSLRQGGWFGVPLERPSYYYVSSYYSMSSYYYIFTTASASELFTTASASLRQGSWLVRCAT
jgi:hypothetical protein